MANEFGLIGYTGFVGSSLSTKTQWDALYNSANISELPNRSFDLLVCAAVSAVKWQANKDPDKDRAAISRLTDVLASANTRELVLISTIDVYPAPDLGGTEDTPIDPSLNQAYGRHRFELEHWARERFENLRVIRLPSLFGKGLRKNVIYDLLHKNLLSSINPAASFQWYPIDRLWGDIQTTRANQLSIVNLFSEPLTMSFLIKQLFPDSAVGPEWFPAPSYDVKTRHGSLFGGNESYVMRANEVLERLNAFITSERKV